MADTTQSSPAISQSDDIYSSLSNFYSQASSGVSSGVFPSLGSISTKLNYSELLTVASNGSGYGSNFMVGSAVETSHLAASLGREYAMRVKSKSEYYSDGQDEHSNEAKYYSSLKYTHGAILSGNSTNGNLTQ